MNAEYELTKDDLSAFSLYHHFHSASHQGFGGDHRASPSFRGSDGV